MRATSSSQINEANYCTMKYYLSRVLKRKSLRLVAYEKGNLIHRTIEHFFDFLGTEEEVEKDRKRRKLAKEKKHFFDRDSFVDYVVKKWIQVIKGDERSRESAESEQNPEKRREILENTICWGYDGQGWVIKNKFPDICRPLFDFLIQIGPPLFSELPFNFLIGNYRIRGRIDEVRLIGGQIVLRDFKTGYPRFKEMKILRDPQLTIYNAGLCTQLKYDSEMRRIFGLEGKIDEFMAGGRFLSPNLREEFFMVEALAVDPATQKIPPQVLIPATREDSDLYEVLDMIDGTRRKINEGIVYPESGKKCDDCDQKYNCLAESKKLCARHQEKVLAQPLLNLNPPIYTQPRTITEPPKLRQPRLRLTYKHGIQTGLKSD
jgi:hypothetical protein